MIYDSEGEVKGEREGDSRVFKERLVGK